MVAKDFKPEDLVWAKMKGYPPWPGKITDPPKDMKIKKAHHYVFFFYTNNYAWIHDDGIEFHSEAMVDKFAKGHKRPPSYLNAVQLIVAAGKNKPRAGKGVEKSDVGSTPDPKKGNSTISSVKKKVAKKMNDLENSSIEASDEKATKGKNIRKSRAPKEPKKQPTPLEKMGIKNVKRKRSFSVELNAGLSPASLTKKQKTPKTESRGKQKKAQKSDIEKSSEKEKEDVNVEPSDGLDSDDEISKKIKDEIAEINAVAAVQRDGSPSTELQLEDWQKPLDFDDRDTHEIESADTVEEEVAEACDFESSVSCNENTISRPKDADKSILKHKKKESSTSDRIGIDGKKTERLKSISEKSKTIQRGLRIGLKKNQKYGASSVLRRSEAATSSHRGKKNDILVKRFSIEDSGSSIENSRGFSSTDHIHLEESVEDPKMSCPVLITKSESPLMDLTDQNETLHLKNVTPSKKKIGFIGLGRMGERIVKNLIFSGHSVTVWDRIESKCDSFAGAEKALYPSDLVMACDIIFSCLANDSASKSVFFGNLGVAWGLRSAAVAGDWKGFVEMTTIDPETSKAINLEVNLKGGRYLEAQLSGSIEQASEGSLLIVAAGDKSLFDDCHSCFIAVSKTAMLVHDQVGVASTYNIIHNMLYGSVYAALAEALALVESIGLKKEVFIDSFMDPRVKSVVNLDKNHLMGKSDCPVNVPLMLVQKSLVAGLKLGSTYSQPMHVNAAANEVYKLCKLLKLDDRDISAVYEAVTKR